MPNRGSHNMAGHVDFAAKEAEVIAVLGIASEHFEDKVRKVDDGVFGNAPVVVLQVTACNMADSRIAEAEDIVVVAVGDEAKAVAEDTLYTLGRVAAAAVFVQEQASRVPVMMRHFRASVEDTLWVEAYEAILHIAATVA